MTQLYLVFALVAATLTNVLPDIKGKVIDEKSKPLPYASVFLKNHPSVGTVSEENGRFTVSADTASHITADAIKRDTLIISMLGYETVRVPVTQLKSDKINVIRMKEYHFFIDEAVVKASKNARKQRKNEMRALLDRIYARAVNVDGPQKGDAYKIVSDIRVFKDSIPLNISRISGTLYEMPGMSSKGKDTSRIVVTFRKDFMDSTIRDAIDNFDISILKRKEKKRVNAVKGLDEEKTASHKVVWGTDIKQLLNMTYKEEKFWDYSQKNDTTLTVTYSRNRGFLGIVKDEERMALTVDSRTFAVSAMAGTLNVHLNLPFAYKLSPGELEVLNIVNLDEEALEKFKIKKADVNMSVIIRREQDGERMLPSEKSMKNSATISDRKDNSFTFRNTCEIEVMGRIKK